MSEVSLQGRLGRIEVEVLYLLPEYGIINYDDLSGAWIHIPHFSPGPRWSRQEVEILIDLPLEYPVVPPTSFWTTQDLSTLEGELIEHFFEKDEIVEEGYRQQGWTRFSLYIGRWEPAPGLDLQAGDSLITFLEHLAAVFRGAV